MTKEYAVRKLMEVAKERFNAGRGITVNNIPFYNYGTKLKMEINEDVDGKVYSMAIMLGVTTVSHILVDEINEIHVDFYNILLEDNGRVFGFINNKHFVCEEKEVK